MHEGDGGGKQLHALCMRFNEVMYEIGGGYIWVALSRKKVILSVGDGARLGGVVIGGFEDGRVR